MAQLFYIIGYIILGILSVFGLFALLTIYSTHQSFKKEYYDKIKEHQDIKQINSTELNDFLCSDFFKVSKNYYKHFQYIVFDIDAFLVDFKDYKEWKRINEIFIMRKKKKENNLIKTV